MGKSRKQRAPRLAYESEEFMTGLVARPLRILAEYFDPLRRLREQNVGDTIVMFGSARILSRERALALLRRAKKGQMTPSRKQRVREAHRAVEMSRYYDEARELARRITAWSLTLGTNPRRFVICSGGGPGIMEAANRGAMEAGGKTLGMNIQLPSEQAPNPYISPELNLNFHYFFMRKLWFTQLAKALIVFPGGFGTMDELFEALTLLQTGKVRGITVVLVGRAFWERLVNWPMLVEEGLVSPEDLHLLHYAETAQEAWDIIASAQQVPPSQLPPDPPPARRSIDAQAVRD